MGAKDTRIDYLAEADGDVVSKETFAKLGWKDLRDHPLSTISRIFGKDYLTTEIGAKPTEETLIELDNIRNFAQLMVEYAIVNRIAGPLKLTEDNSGAGELVGDDIPMLMDMSRRKAPAILNLHVRNLGKDQASMGAEESALSFLALKNAHFLDNYDIKLDDLERRLKVNSPESTENTPLEKLPPTLTEQIIGKIYLASHTKLESEKKNELLNELLDAEVYRSWELVNKELTKILVIPESVRAQDEAQYNTRQIAGYRETHKEYGPELVGRQLRRAAEQAEAEEMKIEEEETYEAAVEVRSGLLFPEMPKSKRRTELYKKSLLATQALILTNFLLKNDLAYGDEIISAYERSLAPITEAEDALTEIKNPPITVSDEQRIDAAERNKEMELLLYKQVKSRDPASLQNLISFVEAASLEYERFVLKKGKNIGEIELDIETMVKQKLTLEQMQVQELTPLEQRAAKLFDY